MPIPAEFKYAPDGNPQGIVIKLLHSCFAGSVQGVYEYFASPKLLFFIKLKVLEIGFSDQVGMIYKLSKTPGKIRKKAPKTGADTADILREIGYKETEIKTIESTITTL